MIFVQRASYTPGDWLVGEQGRNNCHACYCNDVTDIAYNMSFIDRHPPLRTPSLSHVRSQPGAVPLSEDSDNLPLASGPSTVLHNTHLIDRRMTKCLIVGSVTRIDMEESLRLIVRTD